MPETLPQNSDRSKIINVYSKDYPSNLSLIFGEKHSPELTVLGDISNINFAIGIVGSRDVSGKEGERGHEISDYFIDELVNREVVTISGLAEGVDTWVAKKTLENGGRTIAVLPSGINKVFPEINEDLAQEVAVNGAVISPFPKDFEKTNQSPLDRNPIIAAMSLAILVPYGKWHRDGRGQPIIGKRSGTLATVNWANSHGIDVIAIPGSEVTNYLLGHGLASGAETPSQVLDDLVRIRAQRRMI